MLLLMEMSEKILVIFLSGALLIFLVLGIVVLTKIIQIANHVKQIIEKAERIADKAESFSDFLERASTPLAIGRMLANFSDVIFKRSKRKARRRNDA